MQSEQNDRNKSPVPPEFMKLVEQMCKGAEEGGMQVMVSFADILATFNLNILTQFRLTGTVPELLMLINIAAKDTGGFGLQTRTKALNRDKLATAEGQKAFFDTLRSGLQRKEYHIAIITAAGVFADQSVTGDVSKVMKGKQLYAALTMLFHNRTHVFTAPIDLENRTMGEWQLGAPELVAAMEKRAQWN